MQYNCISFLNRYVTALFILLLTLQAGLSETASLVSGSSERNDLVVTPHIQVSEKSGKSSSIAPINGHKFRSHSSSSSSGAFTGVSTGRQLSDWKLTDFLLVATVDGSIHACDRNTGLELWQLEGEGSVVRVQQTEDGQEGENFPEDDLIWIVEPLGDGALYYFAADTGLQKLPISIKQLVAESPFALTGDDKLYTGSRLTTLYSIDARTGKILDVYGSGALQEYCKPKTLEDLDEDDSLWDDASRISDTFLLGRTEYRLEIQSKGRVLWNVSYVVWGPNNMDNDLAVQHTMSIDDRYVCSLHDGVILGVDANNSTNTWAQVLSSPAISVFDIFSPTSLVADSNNENNHLIILPQPRLKNSKVDSTGDASISTYINKTMDGGWYALSEQHFPFLVQNAPGALWNLIPASSRSSKEVTSLIGVHDGKRLTSGSPFPGIEGPVSNFGGYLPGHYYPEPKVSLTRRAFVDIALATPFLMIIYFILKSSSVKNLLASKKSEPIRDSNIFKNGSVENVMEATVDKRIASLPLEQQDLGENEERQGDDSISTGPVCETSNDKDGAQGTIKKRKRGARGGRRNGNGGMKASKEKEAVDTLSTSKEIGIAEDKLSDRQIEIVKVTSKISSTQRVDGSDTSTAPFKLNSLEVSDIILGYGSHGTVVYKGMFEKREVAVKRMLLDFYDVASHEVSLLQESDDHPNVVRYFCKQESERFLYIALELCPATLQDVVEKSYDFVDIVKRMDTQKTLYQITNGLQYLHSLKIVHRDIKPQNILVSAPKTTTASGDIKPVRLLISDFGLCKKLEGDQSSFRATTAHAAGTSGWRAPELLIDDDDGGNNSNNNSGSNSYNKLGIASQSNNGGSTSEPAVIDTLSNRRATRAIDIFSLGCVFYYVLSNGSHPFGDRYMREANIIKGHYSLEYLDALGYEGVEARDLITRMLDPVPKNRPTAADIMMHPYFWSPQKRLDFLLEVSDRFEIEKRDPPSPLLQELESRPGEVVYNDWHKRLDKCVLENLGKYRKYYPDKVLDLLRALRNKKHHYQDLPSNVQVMFGSMPDGFVNYFARKFPNLLMHVYYVVKDSDLRDEAHFRPYFSTEAS
ncbi:hypothetical protein V1511DRAFT_487277 [Dipodascopsis uninucleata]